MWKKLAFILVITLVWQGLASAGFFNQTLLPPPVEVGEALLTLIGSGGLLVDVVMSVKRMLFGFTVAALLGSTLAVLLVIARPVAEYVSTILEIIRPIPPLAWIPIAILWFGVGETPAVFIVALGSFFPIFVNCFAGIRQVDPKLVLVAKSFGVGKRQLIVDVYLPLVLPYLISGMRIGLGVGWMSVITAELIGAQSGLGYMMQLNRVLLQTQNVMAGMVIVGVLGFGMNKLMLTVERAASPWKADQA